MDKPRHIHEEYILNHLGACGIVVSLDGSLFFADRYHNSIFRMNGKLLETWLQLAERPGGLALSSSGTELYVACRSEIIEISIATRKWKIIANGKCKGP